MLFFAITLYLQYWWHSAYVRALPQVGHNDYLAWSMRHTETSLHCIFVCYRRTAWEPCQCLIPYSERAVGRTPAYTMFLAPQSAGLSTVSWQSHPWSTRSVSIGNSTRDCRFGMAHVGLFRGRKKLNSVVRWEKEWSGISYSKSILEILVSCVPNHICYQRMVSL